MRSEIQNPGAPLSRTSLSVSFRRSFTFAFRGALSFLVSLYNLNEKRSCKKDTPARQEKTYKVGVHPPVFGEKFNTLLDFGESWRHSPEIE